MTVTAKLPAITEADWQRQVTDLADLFQWQWVHFRPAQTTRGWRTPVSGTLGKGWPDLVLIRLGRHGATGRTLFVELKRDGAGVTAEQAACLAFLEEAGCETYLWRPADLERVMEILR